MPALTPKSVPRHISRPAQLASDFGVLDLDIDEPDTISSLPQSDAALATAWRWAWRVAVIALVATLISVMFSAPAQADTIGLHTVSWHGRSGYNNTNPGILYRTTDGLTVGAYCNSESRADRFRDAPRCRLSTYAGWHWDYPVIDGLVTVGVTAGALTGYTRARVLPFAVPSVRIGDHVRILYAPAIEPKGTQVLSLVLETEF